MRKAGIQRHVHQPGRGALVVLAIAAPGDGRRPSSPVHGRRAIMKTASSASAARTRSTTPDSRSTTKARARALSYSADQLSMIEHQCGQWPPFYLVKGPFGMKIWNDSDPVTGSYGRDEDRRVGGQGAADDLDGRPSASVEECAPRAWRIHHW